MERFSHRESVLLGYNPHAHRSSSTNPSTPLRNSDVDFHDVFGGPPRRSSVQEMRFSLAESADCGGGSEEEGSSGGREKPVFGEDNSNYRRRHTNYNFYDDIFGGDEISPTCTPRRHERNPFSRIMSPVLPHPSGHDDSFAPSSLPSTLSLPAKMTKGMDIPTFGSPARTLRNNIITSNEQIISSSSDSAATTPLSRFSKEDSKNGGNSRSHRQSLLTQEFSDSSRTNNKADKGSDGGGHFHFSIHKWASKGVVPLVMPLRADRSSRLKDNVKLERSSSAKDWTSLGYNNASSSMNNGKQVGATNFTSSQQASGQPNLETLSNYHHVINDVSGSALSSDTRAESNNYSSSEVGSSGRMKGQKKPESKSLHFLLSKRDDTQVYDEKTKWEKGEESKTKKGEQNNTAVLKGTVEVNATSQGSLSLDEKIGNARVKGKVKEFVRIFSQEDLTKPRVDTKSRAQAPENKLRNASRTKDEVEDNPEISKKEDSDTEAINVSTENLCRQDNISASAIPNSTDVIGDKGGSFHENFQVKELVQEENEVLQTQDNQEVKVIDNKIRQWSNGKEGNIRSLLSTLQYVLWPESGWKAVPLVDIIEGNAVKRAYQRALLCLHPDKLQQKGAAFHQKYIAEKVFDILQEAWTHFNMLGAI